uniref:hypothetical protein n=1 Tax=Yersinia rohdei TaxID=29485 RepID=UPI001643AD60
PGIKSSQDPMPKAWGFCYARKIEKAALTGGLFAFMVLVSQPTVSSMRFWRKKGYFHHENALLMTFTLKFLPFLQPLPQKKNAISIESFNLKLKPCFDYEV